MFINMGTWYYFFMTENVMETVWYDRKTSVAVLVCVEAGKCYYMNGCLYNALKQACAVV